MTPPQANAAATPAGGHPHAAARASATWRRRAASQPLAPACVNRAGGATAAVSAAHVTTHPARRRLVAAPAGQAGGAPSAGSGASACAAAAALSRAGAPAHPASAACAVNCPVPPAAMGLSAVTAVATASRTSPALQTQAAASPASRAGTGPSAASPAPQAPLGRAAGSSVPAAGVGRPVSQTADTAHTVTPAGWGPGVKTPARLAPLGRTAALSVPAVSREPVMLSQGSVSAVLASGGPAATFPAHLASMETTVPFSANAQRDPATLFLGPASRALPVRMRPSSPASSCPCCYSSWASLAVPAAAGLPGGAPRTGQHKTEPPCLG